MIAQQHRNLFFGLLLFALLFSFTFVLTAQATTVWVNEFHYDNSSTDTGEFIEVAGVAGTDLTGWSIVLYNGNGGTVYDTDALVGTIPDQCNGFGTVSISYPSNGLQNGSPDGFALVDNSNSVIQFLSYEGSFTAVGGAADGMLSIDVGVSESSSTAIGDSLQLSGDGTQYSDFVWSAPESNTQDAPNTGQSFGGVSCGEDGDDEPILVYIHEVQGTGSSVAITDTVMVQAIVIGDFSADNQLDGFYVQEEDADAALDPNGASASDGIFIYCGNNNCGSFPTIAVGDLVTVTGVPEEFFNQSQIDAQGGSIVVESSDNLLPTPASVDLPVVGDIEAFYEPFEGMSVNFVDTLYVSEYFQLARFGEVVLYEGGRPFQYTHFDDTPTQAEFDAYQAELDSRRVIMDDDNNRENAPLPNGVFYYPQPNGFSINNFFRGGDTVQNLTGVLAFAFGDYRVLPVDPEYTTTFTASNPRSAAPTSAGSLTVASFNVLNYFLTIDTTPSNNVGVCGASQTLDCRGADSQAELDNQTEKLVSALLELDADVYGLIEMENTPGVEPLAFLVSEMNTIAGAGTYDFVDTGVIGTDAIRVGIIYNTTSVSIVGTTAVLDDPAFVNPRNASIDRNRPALAQSFVEDATGAVFTVVVNHLKSKGSGCGTGDDDPFAGSCNLTRTLAAIELVDWLAADPTGVFDSDILIIGDLNSYAGEDPIEVLTTNATLPFTDLIQALGMSDSYSYVFDGQLGYLDYGLASNTLVSQVADISEWHINADEVNVLDYNDDVRDTGEAFFEEKPDGNLLYEANPFRTSDHDPVFVGLNLIAPTVSANGPYVTNEGSMLVLNASITNLGGDVSYSWDLDGDGVFETAAPGAWLATIFDDGPATLMVSVQACNVATCAIGSTTVTVDNVAPSVAINILPEPPLFQGETATIFLGSVADPSNADTVAGFTFDVDCDLETAFTPQTQFQCVVPLVMVWNVQGSVQDKDGGIGSASLTDLAVLNTHDAISFIIDEVEEIGGLNGGQSNALVTKLEHVQNQLSNNENAALNQINAFINQVQDFQATGVLSSSDAEYLFVLADRLIQSILNS